MKSLLWACACGEMGDELAAEFAEGKKVEEALAELELALEVAARLELLLLLESLPPR